MIKQIAQRCTLSVNKDGSVTTDAFLGCNLLKHTKCISSTTHLIAIPTSIPKSISTCPVLVVDIDVALVELQVSDPPYVSATGLLTKRSFFWTPISRNKALACTHPLTGASILKDEGGYLLTMEIIDHPDLTPTMMLSGSFNQTFYPPSSLSSEALKRDVKRLTLTPKWSALRSKRSVGGSLFQQIEWELSQFEAPSPKNTRPRRTPTLNLLTGATTLQLSFHRAEYQHDITSLASQLESSHFSLANHFCTLHLKMWTALIQRGASPYEFLPLLNSDPSAILHQSENKLQVCLPKLIQPNQTIQMNKGNLQAIWNNQTFWLLPQLGVLSPTPDWSSYPEDAFYVPLLSGCSIDLRSASKQCGVHLAFDRIPLLEFYHNTGPLYTPKELRRLQDLDHSIYQQPILVPSDLDSESTITCTGNNLWGLFEPVTKFWKSLSPNIWSGIYTIIFLLIGLKVCVIMIHNQLRNIHKNRKKNQALKNLETEAVTYHPLNVAHLGGDL